MSLYKKCNKGFNGYEGLTLENCLYSGHAFDRTKKMHRISQTYIVSETKLLISVYPLPFSLSISLFLATAALHQRLHQYCVVLYTVWNKTRRKHLSLRPPNRKSFTTRPYVLTALGILGRCARARPRKRSQGWENETLKRILPKVFYVKCLAKD